CLNSVKPDIVAEYFEPSNDASNGASMLPCLIAIRGRQKLARGKLQ
ncbi:hypothetical protein Tco_1189618, partial [Tanacetum coccineum]